MFLPGRLKFGAKLSTEYHRSHVVKCKIWAKKEVVVCLKIPRDGRRDPFDA